MYIVVVNVRYFIMRISAYAHLHTLSRHYENGDSTDTMQQCYRSLSNWSRFRLWVIVSTWRTEQTTKARERERESARWEVGVYDDRRQWCQYLFLLMRNGSGTMPVI